MSQSDSTARTLRAHPPRRFLLDLEKLQEELDRDGFIDGSALIKKGTSMRSQINLYWQKRAEEKKRRFKKLT